MNFTAESTLKCVTTVILVVAFWLYNCQAWLKYEKGQVALATSEVHASQIPFPSITICAEIEGEQVNASSVDHSDYDADTGKLGFLVVNVTNFDRLLNLGAQKAV